MYWTNSQAASCASCSAKAFMKKFHPPMLLWLSPPSPAGKGAMSIRSGFMKLSVPAMLYMYGQLRQKTASPPRKGASLSGSVYVPTACGVTPSVTMLYSVSRPATDSGLSMITLLASLGSSTSPPWVQMYSRPLTVPPSYSAPWKTNPTFVPSSCMTFWACSLSSSQVVGGRRSRPSPAGPCGSRGGPRP
jgi:hypothetical protein